MKNFLTMLLVVFLLPIPAMAAGCSNPEQETAPFELIVVPQQLNGHSIAGQQCVFLVTIDDYEPSDNQPVKISAMATGTQITIENADIIEGQVAEIIVIPAQSAVNQVIEMEITGTRGKTSQQEKIAFEVVEGEDDRAEYATGIRDRFINWLKTSHPELGISGDTEWNGTMVSPQWLIVSHYLFLSDEWEMHVSWHIMIAPYDWAKIDLRHRFDESAPSYAFEISSLSNNTQPAAAEIPEEVWR